MLFSLLIVSFFVFFCIISIWTQCESTHAVGSCVRCAIHFSRFLSHNARNFICTKGIRKRNRKRQKQNWVEHGPPANVSIRYAILYALRRVFICASLFDRTITVNCVQNPSIHSSAVCADAGTRQNSTSTYFTVIDGLTDRQTEIEWERAFGRARANLQSLHFIYCASEFHGHVVCELLFIRVYIATHSIFGVSNRSQLSKKKKKNEQQRSALFV